MPNLEFLSAIFTEMSFRIRFGRRFRKSLTNKPKLLRKPDQLTQGA